MLLVAYVIETFQCFLITGIVMIGVWWCTNKEWAGYVSAIALITIDRSFESLGLIFGSYRIKLYIQGWFKLRCKYNISADSYGNNICPCERGSKI